MGFGFGFWFFLGGEEGVGLFLSGGEGPRRGEEGRWIGLGLGLGSRLRSRSRLMFCIIFTSGLELGLVALKGDESC